MANESITVYFEPLGQVGGVTYYHETLIYTNSAGVSQYLTSGPSGSFTPTGNVNALSQMSAASDNQATNQPSAWGTLQAAPVGIVPSGGIEGLTTSDTSNPNATYASTIIATCTDLSAQWSTMVSTAQQISSQNLTYSPLTQNSNSMANSAIYAAGLTPLTSEDTGMLSSHWAPGAGNILVDGVQLASDDQVITSSTNQGITTVNISYGNGTGNPADNLTIAINANDNTATVGLNAGNGTLVANETAATLTNGVQTDTLQGVDTANNINYNQNTTIQSSGLEAATIAGKGDVDTLNNATITLASGTQATLDGNGNIIGTRHRRNGRDGGCCGEWHYPLPCRKLRGLYHRTECCRQCHQRHRHPRHRHHRHGERQQQRHHRRRRGQYRPHRQQRQHHLHRHRRHA